MAIKLKWRIYYGDGSTFSSDDGDAKDAPTDGIQAVVQWDRRCGRSVITGSDNYIFTDDQWVGTMGDGDRSHFRSKGLLHHGTIVGRDKYDEIVNKALTDSDFPRKSSWREGEPRVTDGPTS